MADTAGFRLVHDVLDGQLVDRREERIGRIDDLVLELREGEAPRVAAILVGAPARADRVGRWAAWLDRALRGPRERRASRIPFDAVRCVGDTIAVDVDGNALASGHLERWLGRHVICPIPGAGGERK